jgi:hypothetical protein
LKELKAEPGAHDKTESVPIPSPFYRLFDIYRARALVNNGINKLDAFDSFPCKPVSGLSTGSESMSRVV